MKTTNETSGGLERGTPAGLLAKARRFWLREMHGFGLQCGRHFRLEDFRRLPRMAERMDPDKLRTRLFKLSHAPFLCPYFQYFLKIQK